MKKLLIGIMALWLPLLACAQPVQSDAAARMEMARKILDVSVKTEMFERVFAAMEQQLIASMGRELPEMFRGVVAGLQKAGRVSEAQANEMLERMPQYVELYKREELPKMAGAMRAMFRSIDYKRLVYEAGAPFYAENFTLKELRQIYAYQASPLGQKMLERAPDLMARMMPAVSREMGKMVETIAAQFASQKSLAEFLLAQT